MAQTSTQNRGVSILRLVSLMIFGLLIAASITLYFGIHRFLQERTASRFEYDTRATTELISDRFMQYADLLYNGRSLLTLKPDTTNEQWQRFFEGQGGLVRHSGVSSVAYANYAKSLSEAEMTAIVNDQAKINPPIKISPVGERDEYTVVSLIASSSQLSNLLGVDMFSEPARRKTLEHSVATLTPQVTPPLILKSGQQGLGFYLPHFDQNNKLLGFVMLSFRSQNLMDGLLNERITDTATKIVDITDKTSPSELYVSPRWTSDGIERTDQITVGGRTWSVSYSASKDRYQDNFIRAVPLMMLAVGLISSFVVLVAILMIFRDQTSRFGSR